MLQIGGTSFMPEKKQLYHIATEADKAARKQNIKAKNPEEKQYLVCIKAAARTGCDDEWDICLGRTEAREYIKSCIDYIDFEHSFVLVESCIFADRKSIYAFMKHIEGFYEDGFDIDDYVRGDWSEADYSAANDIDSSMYNPQNNSETMMEQIMGGEVNTIPLE